MADADRLLAAMAMTQYGVFTRKQAIAVGVNSRTIDDRTERGMYERIHPGVYAIAGSPVQWRRDVIAAVFAATEPAAASHRTAAYLWAMTDRLPRTVEIATRRHLRVKRVNHQVRESKDLRSSDVVVVDGIPTTSAVRTIVDMGGSAPSVFVEKCLDNGLRMGLFDIWGVQRFIMRVARKGRNGIGTIRPLVEQRLTWTGITESDLEDLLRRVVAESPFPMPTPQHELFDVRGEFIGRFDFAYPNRFSIIECDSEKHHMDRVSFQHDRVKQTRAQMLGWTVYRVTWRQLVDDPESVRAIIATIWRD